MLKLIVHTYRRVINMAIASNVGGAREGGNGDQEQLRTMQQEVCKETIDDWKDSAAEYIRSELFHKKQFVTDADLVLGGDIQKLVCWNLNIAGETRAKIFWYDKGGKETVRNTFRKKAKCPKCNEASVQR